MAFFAGRTQNLTNETNESNSIIIQPELQGVYQGEVNNYGGLL